MKNPSVTSSVGINPPKVSLLRQPRHARNITPQPTVQQARIFAPHAFAARVEIIDAFVPMIFMTKKAFVDMWHIVDMASLEVGWVGLVEETKLGNLLITEVFLLEQEVTAVETDISQESMGMFAHELIQTHPDGIAAANRLRFWGHSHVWGGVNPSGRDEDQMRELDDGEMPWFIRGIANKNGDMRFDLFLWGNGIKVTDIPWAVWDEHVDGANRAKLQSEFDAKVHERRFHHRGSFVGEGQSEEDFFQADAFSLKQGDEHVT